MSQRFNLRLCSLAALVAVAASYHQQQLPPNANHIFNAIHSSMRQWGSSLNHNGMSFFLATVPEGTQLYHGSSQSDPVKGPEWLAFEPEHALVFARSRPKGPPPPGDDNNEKKKKKKKEEEEELRSRPQQVLAPPMDRDSNYGWLHTFAAAKDLRLLYVDGMSAGKTPNGTLDAEDRILFRDQLGNDGEFMDERERAKLFCRMVQERWDDRLDGLLRMEAGFEVILCDFARDLDELRVTAARPSSDRPRPGKGKGKGDNGPRDSWLPAVASRYWGIGGHRVILNYDHFVTAYEYGLDLFGTGVHDGDDETETYYDYSPNALPRLVHLSAGKLDPIRQDLDFLIRNHDPSARSTDWQAVADMVVERYAARLRYLASGQVSALEQLQEEIGGLLTPFIDYQVRNISAEAERCSMQFIIKRSAPAPALAPVTTFGGDAVLSVSHSICTTLLDAMHQTDYSTAIQRIKGLMDYLAWTTWKKCTGCGDHELCVIPMWPMGTVEDYNHPQCRDFSQPNGDGPRYWGNFPHKRKPASSAEYSVKMQEKNHHRS